VLTDRPTAPDVPRPLPAGEASSRAPPWFRRLGSGLALLVPGLGFVSPSHAAPPPVMASFNVFLKAPGAGKTGSADIVADAPSWLAFDGYGAGDQDPVARATSGIYTGAPSVVQMREPWS